MRKISNYVSVKIGDQERLPVPSMRYAIEIFDPFQVTPLLHVRLDHAIRYATGKL